MAIVRDVLTGDGHELQVDLRVDPLDGLDVGVVGAWLDTPGGTTLRLPAGALLATVDAARAFLRTAPAFATSPHAPERARQERLRQQRLSDESQAMLYLLREVYRALPPAMKLTVDVAVPQPVRDRLEAFATRARTAETG